MHIREHTPQYGFISDVSVSANNISRPIFRSGPSDEKVKKIIFMLCRKMTELHMGNTKFSEGRRIKIISSSNLIRD